MNLENISDKLQNVFNFINDNKNEIIIYFNLGVESSENIIVRKIKIYEKKNKPKIFIKLDNTKNKVNYIIKTDLYKFIEFVELVEKKNYEN